MQRHRHDHNDTLYLQLGRHVAYKHPELAKEIIDNYFHLDAIDSNLGNITVYRERYEIFLTTIKTQKSIFDLRRLFASAMLRIFFPGVYNQQHSKIDLGRKGFIKNLAPAIGLKESRTSKLVRQVLYEEKIYDDYRAEVARLVGYLTTNVKAAAC